MESIVFILGFLAIISFIAFKSNFFGLKLMAGMSWFGFLIWFRDNSVTGFEPGTGAHVAVWVIGIGFGLMIVLAGLGRGIQRSQKWGNGGYEQAEGFQWKLPDWMKANEDTPEKRTENTNKALDDYRETLRRAYRSGEFRNKRR